MKIKVYTLNAFAKSRDGGNPAGVVVDADSLSEKNKQAIAKEVGFSETAFVQDSNKGDFKVQFFTPNKEVELCGHATIATFFLLFKKRIVKKGDFLQETKAGILKVKIAEKGLIYMSQNLPRFLNIMEKEEIAMCLKIPVKDMMDSLPVQVVSTGGVDIMIPIKHLKTVLALKPDMNLVLATSRKHNIEGFCAFTTETKFNSTAHSRSFAPAVGIPEDPACGVQAGALSCYLHKYGLIPDDQVNNLVFEQGYSMNKPSEIISSLRLKNNEITEVLVGGRALNIKAKELEI